MTIQYRTTPQNHIDFNLYVLSKGVKESPTKPKTDWIMIGIFSLLLILDFSGLLSFGKIARVFSVICLSFLLIERLLKFLLLASVKSNVKRNYKDTLSTLTLIDDAIKCIEDQVEMHTFKYLLIEKVVLNKDCYYIFLGEKRAFLIPVQAFTDDIEKKAFIDMVLEKTGVKFEVSL